MTKKYSVRAFGIISIKASNKLNTKLKIQSLDYIINYKFEKKVNNQWVGVFQCMLIKQNITHNNNWRQ